MLLSNEIIVIGIFVAVTGFARHGDGVRTSDTSRTPALSRTPTPYTPSWSADLIFGPAGPAAPTSSLGGGSRGVTVGAVKGADDELRPVFRSTNRNITVGPGERAVLKCRVENLGTKTVAWRKQGEVHPLTIGLFQFAPDTRVSVDYNQRSTEWSLIIQDVRPTDEGVYRCQISTKHDRDSYDIRLNVKNIQVSGTEFLETGSRIELICNATGKPDPPHNVDWYKNTGGPDGLAKIHADNAKGILVTKKIETRVLMSTLVIRNSHINDSGEYICRSSSRDSGSINVKVINASPAAGVKPHTGMEPSNPVLDLMLKALLQSKTFKADNSSSSAAANDKNWTTVISKLVPGTTVKQCQKRYDELRREQRRATNGNSQVLNCVSSAGQQSSFHSSDGDLATRVKNSNKNKANGERKTAEDKENVLVKNTDTGSPSADLGPIMVIHVCDEAKKLKQDFTCARDLLVAEMRYFAEYLSTDSQRMEEVDISVHCDVQIFDWLLKYVKRSKRDTRVTPTLEPSNVISILISSDFLKMDSLVQECVEFCHANMTEIVATPCNMNCIDDRLVTKIADLFNHNELDDIKDRKDKFKSKLFAKKVESLFDKNYSSVWSPGNASTLYRCSICRKILTKNFDKKIKCSNSRMSIDHRGQFNYCHVVDNSFDVSDYVLDLKNQKSWSDVYWLLWGTVNHLECARCGDTFQCSDLSTCRYHPETASFEGGGGSGGRGGSYEGGGGSGGRGGSLWGEHPCCGARVTRFDVVALEKGCRVRDHVVDPDTCVSVGMGGGVYDTHQVHSDLLAHRDSICQSHQRAISHKTDNTEVDIFAADEVASGLRGEEPACSNFSTHDSRIVSRPRTKPASADREATYDDKFFAESDDDEVGDDEEIQVRRRKPKSAAPEVQSVTLDTSDFNTTKLGKWDTSRSVRYNQDSQREEGAAILSSLMAVVREAKIVRICVSYLPRAKSAETLWPAGLVRYTNAVRFLSNERRP